MAKCRISLTVLVLVCHMAHTCMPVRSPLRDLMQGGELFMGDHTKPAPKVKLGAYVEIDCPFCQGFFSTQLEPTWTELKDIMDVDVYAYGNANDTALPSGGYRFHCQHGPQECAGNMMLACAQAIIPDKNVFVDFSLCVMTDETEPAAAGPRCSRTMGLSFNDIENCTRSLRGQKLLHEVGEQTRALKPPHEYVPWLVVNGVHNDLIQNATTNNLMEFICSEYTGVPPAACQ